MDASQFSRLSPELRNHIYSFVFTSKYAVTLKHDRVQHALTQTCRRIRTESLGLYCSLTRFNAHLDDGPATPLAAWLRVLGPDLTVLVNEINVWDMHNLNATLHGQEATADLLRSGPPVEDFAPSEEHQAAGPWAKEGESGSASSTQVYVLRPIDMGLLDLKRTWYLKVVWLTLRDMGLTLLRFCVVEKNDADGVLWETSEFALVRGCEERR